jgi:Glyoxalase-like domain
MTLQLQLDHILWGAPDLDEGIRQFAGLTGATPVVGGTHPGFGTRNRLLSLGGGVFFEIISPDPAQTQASESRAAHIAAMPYPALLTFAVQTADLDAACTAAEAAGLALKLRVPMSRTRPDGVRLAWTVAQFAHPLYGDLIPFAIDWQGSPHPATTTPGGCTLRSLTALHPDPAPLRDIYQRLGLGVPVQAALRPGIVVVLDTPKGDVCLLSP